jgi:hypothetical protein
MCQERSAMRAKIGATRENPGDAATHYQERNWLLVLAAGSQSSR